MTEEQFNQLNSKLDALNANVARTHAEEFQWANAIMNRQLRFENRLGFDTTPREFVPYYNPTLTPSPVYPEVFNKHGERMEFFFISDRSFAHSPQSKNSRYIIWDRYNYGNETHFYKDEEVFRIVGKPKRRYAVISESPAVVTPAYENALKHRDYIEKNFVYLFTHDARLLSNIKNARFVAFGAFVWYGTNMGGCMFDAKQAGFPDENQPKDFIISPENYKRKTKNISIIASQKEFCPMHVVRKKLAFKCKNESLADTYGKFDGGAYCEIEEPFEKYRYSIVVENAITPFYFTEKIMNAFVAQTIPIYLGATEIARFFNADGIIQIGLDDCDHIENILKRCTVEEYERRLPAVLDNFNRAMATMSQTRFDDMYVQYIRGK